MKAKTLILSIAIAATLPCSAQHFRNSQYYNPETDRLDYSQRNSRYSILGGNYYVGLRLGATFSTVQSDDPLLDSGQSRTGLNLGIVAGMPLSRYTPLYLESGLLYNEKGGKKGGGRENFSYSLNYLEVPVTVKYSISPTRHVAIQPYAGGYLACGVGGKIKNFRDREAYSAFGDDTPTQPRFSRFDGGLKIGCGVAYDALYADIAYEHGLANISNDTFDSTHNTSFMISIGVNF